MFTSAASYTIGSSLAHPRVAGLAVLVGAAVAGYYAVTSVPWWQYAVDRTWYRFWNLGETPIQRRIALDEARDQVEDRTHSETLVGDGEPGDACFPGHVPDQVARRRPRHRKRYARHLAHCFQARYPQLVGFSEANELVALRFMSEMCIEHGVRPTHAREIIPVAAVLALGDNQPALVAAELKQQLIEMGMAPSAN